MCLIYQIFAQCTYFQNQIKSSLETLILQIYFVIIQMGSIRGDLTDFSAMKVSLIPNYKVYSTPVQHIPVPKN